MKFFVLFLLSVFGTVYPEIIVPTGVSLKNRAEEYASSTFDCFSKTGVAQAAEDYQSSCLSSIFPEKITLFKINNKDRCYQIEPFRNILSKYLVPLLFKRHADDSSSMEFDEASNYQYIANNDTDYCDLMKAMDCYYRALSIIVDGKLTRQLSQASFYQFFADSTPNSDFWEKYAKAYEFCVKVDDVFGPNEMTVISMARPGMQQSVRTVRCCPFRAYFFHQCIVSYFVQKPTEEMKSATYTSSTCQELRNNLASCGIQNLLTDKTLP